MISNRLRVERAIIRGRTADSVLHADPTYDESMLRPGEDALDEQDPEVSTPIGPVGIGVPDHTLPAPPHASEGWAGELENSHRPVLQAYSPEWFQFLQGQEKGEWQEPAHTELAHLLSEPYDSSTGDV